MSFFLRVFIGGYIVLFFIYYIIILEIFATTYSKSVQETQLLTANLILKYVPEISILLFYYFIIFYN